MALPPPARDGAGWVVRLPHEPTSARYARTVLSGGLEQLSVGEHTIDDALLIASELVSNSVRHAGALNGDGCIEMRWSLDGDVLRIEVADGGPLLDGHRRIDPPPPDEAGRGLFLVNALSDDVHVQRDRERSVTTAVLSIS